MTVVACLLAVALVATIVICLRLLETQQATHDQQQDKWRDERRELLERIQRPELVPSRPIMQFDFPDTDPDETALVGTIHYEDTEG